jgi:hypothetical protein
MELRFTSALSPADLMARLQKGAKTIASPGDHGASPPVWVRFHGTNFTLGKIRGYRDSLAPCFRGSVLEQGHGAVIIGEFSPHPSLAVALTLALLVVGMALLPSDPERQMHPALLVTPCALLLSAGAVALTRWLGRAEKTLLADYLEACCRDQALGPP